MTGGNALCLPDEAPSQGKCVLGFLPREARSEVYAIDTVQPLAVMVERLRVLYFHFVSGARSA